MKLDRALRLQAEYANRIRDTFSCTVHFERTHDSHIKEMTRIYESEQYRKLPQHARAYCRGVADTLWNQLYSVSWGFKTRQLTPEALPMLEAISIGTDGRQFRENDDSWLNESSEYKLAMQCKHVWRKAMDRGETKFWS